MAFGTITNVDLVISIRLFPFNLVYFASAIGAEINGCELFVGIFVFHTINYACFIVRVSSGETEMSWRSISPNLKPL